MGEESSGKGGHPFNSLTRSLSHTRSPKLARGTRRRPFDKPFDFTQGHESFDLAQDPEVLEGPGRMAQGYGGARKGRRASAFALSSCGGTRWRGRQ